MSDEEYRRGVWKDAVQEAHRRMVPLTEVLAEVARGDVQRCVGELRNLVPAPRAEQLAKEMYGLDPEQVDWAAVVALAERLLGAASAAEMFGRAGSGELLRDVAPG